MPNRIIRESICTSETINQLTAEEERFFYRLLVQCDDFGRFDARPAVVRAACFPLKTDEISLNDIERMLERLQEVGLIQLYEVEGRRYLQIVTWDRYQQKRAKHSKYPAPPQVRTSDSKCNHVPSSDGSCAQEPSAASTCPRESRNENREARSEKREPAACMHADAITADDGAASAAVTEGRGDADSPSRRLPGSVVAAEIAALEEQERAAVPAIIRQAFWKVTGRDIDDAATVLELLDIAPPELIAQTILEVGERERAAGNRIRTIRYFVGAVRDAVERQRHSEDIDYWLPDPNDPVEIERRKRKAEFEGQGQRRSETA